MSYPPQPPHDPQQPYQPPVVGGHGYGQPADQYGQTPQGFQPSQQPPKRRLWPFAALAVALLVAGGAAYVAYDRGVIFKDSGVKACEALRDGDKTFSGDAQNDKPLTEAQYRELRGVFEDSRYDDIKDHGTKLIDVVWQVSQLGKEPGMEALAYIGPLTTHMTGLQSACADQGVIVTLKPAANTSAQPESGELGIPACAKVFAVGKKIDMGFAGECSNADGQPWSVLAMDCTDGRKLYQVDQVSGATPGWGYGGGKFKDDDPASPDSKFGDALIACTS